MKNSFFFPLPLLLGVSGVVKSPFDEKQYLSFTIPDNGLAVLLISKPDLDKSSAALDVRTGYFCDPDTLPGLAHFLEHMLFLVNIRFIIVCVCLFHVLKLPINRAPQSIQRKMSTASF